MTGREVSDPANALEILFAGDALVPAVIQDGASGAVLMLGYMNREALDVTRATARTHFWSRSRAKLWQKGETSGHIQTVQSIAVNCEMNSLLITVRQVGAVCHEGYGTCFFRQLAEDGSLIVNQPLLFDPQAVYDGTSPQVTSLWVGAYEYLRDNELTDRSHTSALLHATATGSDGRVADELAELAGVLDGSHVHQGLQADALLEGGQCLYWLIVATVGRGLTWSDMRPDTALRTDSVFPDTQSAAAAMRARSDQWRAPRSIISGEALHQCIVEIAAALRTAGVEPGAGIIADLVELRNKSYLADYFASVDAEGDGSLAFG